MGLHPQALRWVWRDWRARQGASQTMGVGVSEVGRLNSCPL